MTKHIACPVCLLLLISGYADVFGFSTPEKWGASRLQWYEEKCPDSIRWAQTQAKADVQKFTRMHPSGLWSGFVASFGAKRRMCRPGVRSAYLESARRFFNQARSGRRLRWDTAGRAESTGRTDRRR